MNRWWRAYDEAVDDPKLQRLPGELFKAWFNLMCLASRNGGALPSAEDIAFSLRKSVAQVETLLETFQQRCLLDEVDGRLEPHNWRNRQYKSDVSTERVKAFRKRQRNVSSNVAKTSNETPPDTDTDTETEHRKKERRACAWPFDEFWALYPNKIGKQGALRVFEKIERSGRVTFENLRLGLSRYFDKTDDRPWCNPETWLNQGRWEDQPATGPPRVNGHPTPMPRHGSREDRAERTANALAALRQQAGFDTYEPGRGGPPSDDPVGLLPFAKPAGP